MDGYIQPWHTEIIEYYNRANVLNLDRESSVIATLCTLFQKRGGAVFSIDNNIVTGERFIPGQGHDDSIQVVLEGLANLHNMDVQKEKKNLPCWVPEEIE